MITNVDIDLMADWQDEIYSHRTHPINLTYETIVYDEILGTEDGVESVDVTVDAVVTEISSGEDEYMVGGIRYEKGDVKIDVKLVDVLNFAESIKTALYDGKEYRLLSSDKKGIGKRNRVEFLGRVIS